MGGHKMAEKNQMSLENVYSKVRKLHDMSPEFKLTNENHVTCMTTRILADPDFQMKDLSLDSKKFISLHNGCIKMGFTLASKKSPKATPKVTKKSSYY